MKTIIFILTIAAISVAVTGLVWGDQSKIENQAMNGPATGQHQDTSNVNQQSAMPGDGSVKHKAETKLSGVYTCPMPEHYHALQYGPGDCPECGMKLVPVEKTGNKEVYVCPMPEDSVVSGKSGECPVCGMNLVKLNTDVSTMNMPDSGTAAAHEHNQGAGTDLSKDTPSGVYTCPMASDYDVVQYGEGNCPKCGMKLVAVEKTSNKAVYFCPMTEDKYVSGRPGNCPTCGMKLQKLESEKKND